MAIITLTCPHDGCLKERMTFDISGARRFKPLEYQGQHYYSVTAFCRSCERGVALILQANAFAHRSGQGPDRLLHLDGEITSVFDLVVVWPEKAKPVAPGGLSSAVERIFLQAEDNRVRQNLESAGIMYRKSLDVASVELGLDLKQTNNLKHRVRLLQEGGKLTPAIADWADRIRLLGNDAAHEADEPTTTEIADLANLTRMALIYLFEMPKRIADMRAAAAAGGAEAT